MVFTLAAGLLALTLPTDRASARAGTESETDIISAYLASNCTVNTSLLGLDAEEQAAIDATNAYRAAYSLHPLQFSTTLERVAAWKSTDIAVRSYMAHDDGFRTWTQRFTDCGYNYQQAGAMIGENLAAGRADAQTTVAQWQASPLHNDNLLNPAFTAIGIKRVRAVGSSDPYGWYWAMELGSDPSLGSGEDDAGFSPAAALP